MTRFLPVDPVASKAMSERLLELYDNGTSTAQIAALYGVCPQTIKNTFYAMGVSLVGRWHGKFWRKVQKTDGGCWIWNGWVDHDGYGGFTRPGSTCAGAHRVSYELSFGPIPEGLVVDHVCAVKRCVNPAHLRACTTRDNTLAPWTDTPARLNTLKTHCPRGHEYSGVNLRVYRRMRLCKRCQNERSARRRLTRRAA